MFFGKHKVKDDGILQYLVALILNKSTLLVPNIKSDKDRREIIQNKYLLSKCDPVIYAFCKYCSKNLFSIHVDFERHESRTDSRINVYIINDLNRGNRGFMFWMDGRDIRVRIKMSVGWKDFSTSVSDYLVLHALYNSITNVKDIDKKIQEQKELDDAKNEYLQYYRS
ncbi:hypothetical protein A4_500 [Escherichia phage A4]|nr:hypothetical protein A4_500 [Escherichia phage A4]